MKREIYKTAVWFNNDDEQLLRSPATYGDACVVKDNFSFADLAELGRAIIECLRDRPEGQELAAHAMTMSAVHPEQEPVSP